MSSAPTNTTTTNLSAPWQGQQGPLENVFGQAGTIYNDAKSWPQYYNQGSTVSGLTAPQLQQGQQQYQYGQQGGDQALQAANNSTAQISSGYYMNNQNPDLQNVEQQATAQALPAIQSQFIAGGGMNGGLAAQASAAGISNTVGQLGYQNYNDQIQNMERANLAAPGVDQAQASDLAQGANYGNMLQNQNQAQLNNSVQEWNYNQNLPINMLGVYDNFVSGNYGSQGSTTTPVYHNQTASAVGGALGGAATGASLGSMAGPYGTAIGAVGGGIAGLLSGLYS